MDIARLFVSEVKVDCGDTIKTLTFAHDHEIEEWATVLLLNGIEGTFIEAKRQEILSGILLMSGEERDR